MDESYFVTTRRVEAIQEALKEDRVKCGKFPSSNDGISELTEESGTCSPWTEKSNFEKQLKLMNAQGLPFRYISDSETYQLFLKINGSILLQKQPHPLLNLRIWINNRPSTSTDLIQAHGINS